MVPRADELTVVHERREPLSPVLRWLKVRILGLDFGIDLEAGEQMYRPSYRDTHISQGWRDRYTGGHRETKA